MNTKNLQTIWVPFDLRELFTIFRLDRVSIVKTVVSGHDSFASVFTAYDEINRKLCSFTINSDFIFMSKLLEELERFLNRGVGLPAYRFVHYTDEWYFSRIFDINNESGYRGNILTLRTVPVDYRSYEKITEREDYKKCFRKRNGPNDVKLINEPLFGKEATENSTYEINIPGSIKCKYCKATDALIVFSVRSNEIHNLYPEESGVWPGEFCLFAVYLCPVCGMGSVIWWEEEEDVIEFTMRSYTDYRKEMGFKGAVVKDYLPLGIFGCKESCQEPFSETRICPFCKIGVSFIAFGLSVPLLIEEHPNIKGIWPHDFSAFAVYICTSCGKGNVEWNQM